MRVAIHQPQYLPWLGYLAKWAAADVFVFLDTVQYEKNGWQNRNRIKTPTGPRWLTVPVHARLGTPIDEVTVDTAQPWGERHLRAIEQAEAAHEAEHEPAAVERRQHQHEAVGHPWRARIRCGFPAGEIKQQSMGKTELEHGGLLMC